jgi:hypothetical protein
MRPWGPLLALVAAAVFGNACLIDLDHVLACGDAYVDAAAGEECDPNDPEEAYKAACPNNNGGCDPTTCQIIADEAQCAKCGDGVIDVAAGEECDGSNIGAQCWGDGRPTCTPPSSNPDSPGCRLDYSTCDPCGNDMVDPGEECDDVTNGGDLVTPVSCAGSIEEPPLRSPYVEYPYTSGQTVTCLPNCEYDRTNCAYCGNGTINGPLFVSLTSQALSLAEVCDGDEFDKTEQTESFPLCAELGAYGNVACNANCLGYTPRGGQECCLPRNSPCPSDGESLRCCYEYAHPDAPEYCLPVILPTGEDEGGSESGGEGGGAFVCR